MAILDVEYETLDSSIRTMWAVPALRPAFHAALHEGFGYRHLPGAPLKHLLLEWEPLCVT